MDRTRTVLSMIAEACLQDREEIFKYVKAPWLHVLDNLLALVRRLPKPRHASSNPETNYEVAVDHWRCFGEALGFNETNLRRDVAIKRRKAMGGPKGCSWLRCPLFESAEVVTGNEFLRCSRCKKARSSSPTTPQTYRLMNPARFSIVVSAVSAGTGWRLTRRSAKTRRWRGITGHNTFCCRR